MKKEIRFTEMQRPLRPLLTTDFNITSFQFGRVIKRVEILIFCFLITPFSNL